MVFRKYRLEATLKFPKGIIVSVSVANTCVERIPFSDGTVRAEKYEKISIHTKSKYLKN